MAIPLQRLALRNDRRVDPAASEWGDQFPWPDRYTLCLTYRCQFACGHCTLRRALSGSVSDVDEMPVSRWIDLLDKTAFTGAAYTLFGGEPLLYPDIDQLIRRLGEGGHDAEIVTNGYDLARYMDILLENRINIIVSLDGTEPVHDRIRGRSGSHAKIFAVLNRLLVECPGELRNIGVNCVMSPDNVRDLPRFLETLTGYPLGLVMLQHLQYTNPDAAVVTDHIWRERLGLGYGLTLTPNRRPAIDDEYVRELCRFIAGTKERYGERLGKAGGRLVLYPDLPAASIRHYYYDDENYMLLPGRHCRKPWRNPIVSPTGDVANCVGSVVGNIHDESFWRIWNGPENRRFRDCLSATGAFPACARCCDLYRS